jgi:capsule polysaccharide export protein KpsC/LpsZ
MVIATNKTIASVPHLATFLADRPRAVAGWGRKPSGRRAVWLSRLLRRPLALLEDGFIRSVARNSPPLSLLVDDLGVYYDARRPSRMEQTIAEGATPADADRARKLAALWRANRVSKYNHAPDYAAQLPGRYVLVVDQTFGDLSITGGLATSESFPSMLTAAIAENPEATIVVKVHPDVFTKGKQGHFPPALLDHPRVLVIDADCHAPSLIAAAEAVYCVTSLMGFEALLWGRRVRCFGMPFYAGWGLTDDHLPAPRRRGRAALEDVVHAALVALARYVDPASGRRWEAENAIAHVAESRTALYPPAAALA